MDLFEHALNQRITEEAPLAARMRPRALDEFVGQEGIVGEGRLLRRAIQADRLFSSILLWGPPGTGKTTLARLIANHTQSHFETLSAVLAGKPDLRNVIKAAHERRKLYHKRTTLFVDEVHRWNKAQQDALLPHVENGTITLIGATTENPYFEVIGALVSRSRIFQLRPLRDADVQLILERALADEERGVRRAHYPAGPRSLEPPDPGRRRGRPQRPERAGAGCGEHPAGRPAGHPYQPRSRPRIHSAAGGALR